MEHYIKGLDRKNKEFEDVKLKFWDYTIINQIIPAKKKNVVHKLLKELMEKNEKEITSSSMFMCSLLLLFF